MAYNTNEILRLIKARPGIRQVEIADRVDCDFEAVPNALKEQVELGNVMRKWVTGPNMVQQVAYHLAPNFELPDEPEQVKGAAPAPTPAPVTPEKPKSKVQLALDYLATVEKADDKAMRTAMGLHLGANVRAYLATQLQKRQVIQVAGGFYKLGDGKPLVKGDATGPTDAERVAQNDKQAMGKEDARKSPDLKALTPEDMNNIRSKLAAAGLQPVAQVAPAPDVAVANLTPEQRAQFEKSLAAAPRAGLMLPETERPFACAVWSDSKTLQMSRNGQIIATLTENETKTMLKYLVNHNFS